MNVYSIALNVDQQYLPEYGNLMAHYRSATAFVEACCEIAMEHNAAHHIYLQNLAHANFAHGNAILADFAYQYFYYAKHFTDYIEALLTRIDNYYYYDCIQENLSEELGFENNQQHKTHSQLFKEFQQAIGVDSQYYEMHQPSMAVLTWQQNFMKLCQSPCYEVGLSALGLGTELIVPQVYRYILAGIENYTDLSQEQYSFFSMHCQADEKHSEDFINILIDVASDEGKRPGIYLGLMQALALREKFWDALLNRAERMG